MAGFAQSSFVPGKPGDEAAIRLILSSDNSTYSNSMAPDLDWENAFGIRYTDKKKRDVFYHKNVDPLQATSIQTLLEIKIKFIADDVAVADVYNHRIGQIDQATGKAAADRWTRSTDIFKKQNGSWSMIVHRVADLRSPWYQHYDRLPASAPMPSGTLASYAGRYEFTSKSSVEEVTLVGDHLTITSDGSSRTLIPTSATSFLLFDPDDLAEYRVVTFGKDSAGAMTLSFARAGDKIFATGTKVK